MYELYPDWPYSGYQIYLRFLPNSVQPFQHNMASQGKTKPKSPSLALQVCWIPRTLSPWVSQSSWFIFRCLPPCYLRIQCRQSRSHLRRYSINREGSQLEGIYMFYSVNENNPLKLYFKNSTRVHSFIQPKIARLNTRHSVKPEFHVINYFLVHVCPK